MISKFELIIIDECSMVNLDMIDNIFDEIINIKNHNMKSNQYEKTSKIIFSGDPAQLPPVNEENSSIFCKNSDELPFSTYVEIINSKLSDAYTNVSTNASTNILERRYKLLLNELENMESFLLKNVVRSKIKNVTNVCNEFRLWVTSENIPNLKQYMGTTGVYFYEYNQKKEKVNTLWFEIFLKSIKDTKKNDISIILTWTRRQTKIYNDTIRKIIFGSKNINKFEKNDILMLDEFYGLDLGEEFVKQRLYTSEQIKVVSTKISQVPINKFESVNNHGLRKMKFYVKIDNNLQLLIKGLNQLFCDNISFKCWILGVNKCSDDDSHIMTIIVIDDDDLDRYNKMKKESALAIKNYSKQLLNQYKTNPKQIERFVIKPLWKQWKKIYVDPFANVNYGYSITCHKGQGSNFYNVFVDVEDILLNVKTIEAKKCTYTAVSRTINELFLLI